MQSSEPDERIADHSDRSNPSPAKKRARELSRIFIPIGLLALSFILWVGFQSWQLLRERENLHSLLRSQDPLVQNSQKLRQMLDVLATQTAKLAEAGNGNAKLIVDELRKRGVTINPNATAEK